MKVGFIGDDVVFGLDGKRGPMLAAIRSKFLDLWKVDRDSPAIGGHGETIASVLKSKGLKALVADPPPVIWINLGAEDLDDEPTDVVIKQAEKLIGSFPPDTVIIWTDGRNLPHLKREYAAFQKALRGKGRYFFLETLSEAPVLSGKPSAKEYISYFTTNAHKFRVVTKEGKRVQMVRRIKKGLRNPLIGIPLVGGAVVTGYSLFT